MKEKLTKFAKKKSFCYWLLFMSATLLFGGSLVSSESANPPKAIDIQQINKEIQRLSKEFKKLKNYKVTGIVPLEEIKETK